MLIVKTKKIAGCIVTLLFTTSLLSNGWAQNIVLGADKVDTIVHLLQKKRVGLVINPSSRLSNGAYLLDTLRSRSINVLQIFTPEHGFRGDADAGEYVSNDVDYKTGIPIASLYGKQKRPTPSQMKNLDVVLFDIQDVGARFYTYISTLHHVMDVASEYNVEVMIADRPNPHDTIDGPVLETPFRSFVGMHPIPVLHGLTVGELAQMINGERWLTNGRQCKLSIISVDGWRHGDHYSLPVRPSPNLPNDLAIRLYPSLCFFESTRVSIGRGTDMPFQAIGYPDRRFGNYVFEPHPRKGSDKNPLQAYKKCYGVDLRKTHPPKGIHLKWLIDFSKKMKEINRPFFTSPRMMDLLSGSQILRKQIIEGLDEEQIRSSWQKELQKYRSLRKKYLIYPDYL